MELTTGETALLAAFRRLPPDVGEHLASLAERMAIAAEEAPIDWSDSWSDEDLKDLSAQSFGLADRAGDGN